MGGDVVGGLCINVSRYKPVAGFTAASSGALIQRHY